MPQSEPTTSALAYLNTQVFAGAASGAGAASASAMGRGAFKLSAAKVSYLPSWASKRGASLMENPLVVKQFRLEDMASPFHYTQPTTFEQHQNQNIPDQWIAMTCFHVLPFAVVFMRETLLPLPWLSHHGWNTGWHTSIYKRIRKHRIAAHEEFMNWTLSTLSDFYPCYHNQDPSNLKSEQLYQNPCWQLLASA